MISAQSKTTTPTGALPRTTKMVTTLTDSGEIVDCVDQVM